MSGPRVEMLAAFGPYEGGWRDGEFHNPGGSGLRQRRKHLGVR